MRVTRTRIGTAALAAIVALGACGDGASGGGEAAEGNATGDDGWSYTDGSGTETTLDEVPTRIVAHATSAAALMSFGITPVGIYADTAVDDDLALSGVDLDGIEIVGEEWGVINVEAVAALDPDLVVSEWWPVEGGYTGMEDGAGTALDTMREIAPVVGVAQGPSIVGMIEDYAKLAESLGADLDDPDIAADRAAFDEAVAGFEAAVEGQRDLSVLAVSPTTESLYVAVPEHSAELADFTDEGFEYWEALSWENADKYQADLLIVDQRGYPANLGDAEAQPIWTSLDAAAAGAVAVWPAYWMRTYDAYAGAPDDLTAAIEEADPQLVP